MVTERRNRVPQALRYLILVIKFLDNFMEVIHVVEMVFMRPTGMEKISCSWVGTNDNFHRRDLGHWLDPREEEADGVERVEGTLYVSKYCVLSRNEYIYGNIHVTGTGQLTISSNIETSGICPLTVESGGKLIINGGKLSNANLNLKPGATLQIMNGGIIETQHGFKAPVGVKVEISHGRIL